jgi:two-component system sensor histidine kinase DegS
MVDNHNLDERIMVLSALLIQALDAQEDERRTVTHSLREEIGQALAALALNLRVLEQRGSQPPDVDMLNNMRRLTSRALHDLEQLQRRLYPPALESQGLIAALEVYIRDFVQVSQVRVELDAEVLPFRLPTAIEIALFRMLQDILEQLCRQAHASEVLLQLRLIKQYAYLVIEFDGSTADGDWHTALIVERAGALGGRCALTALPFAGTRFEIALPLLYEKDSA